MQAEVALVFLIIVFEDVSVAFCTVLSVCALMALFSALVPGTRHVVIPAIHV